MKLVTIADEHGGRPGLLHGDSIFDLRVGHPSLSLSSWRPDSLIAVVNAGEAGREALSRLSEALDAADGQETASLRAAGALLPFAGTRLAPPIRRSGLVLSLEESSEGLLEPYIKSGNTLLGPNERITLPLHLGGTTSVTAQIAVVLARPGHQLTARQTRAAIGGYVLALDVTHETESGVTQRGSASYLGRVLGKQLPGFYPMGPYLVTADDIDAEEPHLDLTINGVAAASWSAVGLVPRLEEALVWLSRYFSFRPGDVVGFSAPGAIGAPVNRGDHVCLRSTHLGELELRVTA